MIKKAQKIREKIEAERDLSHMQAELNRARSVTVGTAFGGITEISMRRNNGEVVWCLLQPVEVMEFIHQLSANIGCHINIIPRQDFASWRDWRLTPEEIEHYRGLQMLPGHGWPPHANDMAPHAQLGASLPSPEKQQGLPQTNDGLGTTPNQQIKKRFLKKYSEAIKKELT